MQTACSRDGGVSPNYRISISQRRLDVPVVVPGSCGDEQQQAVCDSLRGTRRRGRRDDRPINRGEESHGRSSDRRLWVSEQVERANEFARVISAQIRDQVVQREVTNVLASVAE